MHDDTLKADSVKLLALHCPHNSVACRLCSQCFCGDWNTAGSSLSETRCRHVILHLLFCSLPAHLALFPDVWFPAIRCLNTHAPPPPFTPLDYSGSLLVRTYLLLCGTQKEATALRYWCKAHLMFQGWLWLCAAG